MYFIEEKKYSQLFRSALNYSWSLLFFSSKKKYVLSFLALSCRYADHCPLLVHLMEVYDTFLSRKVSEKNVLRTQEMTVRIISFALKAKRNCPFLFSMRCKRAKSAYENCFHFILQSIFFHSFFSVTLLVTSNTVTLFPGYNLRIEKLQRGFD